MARLIEAGIETALPRQIILLKDDLLVFAATGGKIISGQEVLQFLGPFYPAVITTRGEIIAPEGSPGKIMFLACRAGVAAIEVIMGDPWYTQQSISYEVTVKNI